MSSQPPKRVLLIAGLTQSLINFRGPFLKALVAEGYQVFACGPEDDPQVLETLESLGVTFLRIPLNRSGLNPLKDLTLLLSLKSLCDRHRPDVVFSYTIKPVIYGSLAAAWAKVPRVIALLTGLGYVFTENHWKPRLLRLGVSQLYRAALASCDVVFFQNRDDQNLFVSRHWVASEKTQVVAGSGVDLDHYRPAPLPEGPMIFLLIARLIREKGLFEYIEAAHALKARYPEARFQLLGPFDEHPTAVTPQELQQWCDLGSIEYLGETKDVRPFLAQCHVYVLPSYREGTPRSVLEALATGRPIITTDAPGCRETVISGQNGLLVPPKSSQALADAMATFLDNPQSLAAMASASLELAQTRYDVQLVNAQLLNRFC